MGKMADKTNIAALVRPDVRALLQSSTAFRTLPPEKQKQIVRDTVKVASYLAQPAGNRPAVNNEFVSNVNFPDFVSRLLVGVFNAIVDASIQQTEAYADLVKAVAGSLDEFRDQNISDDQARDWLIAKYPKFFRLARNRGSVCLARNRQQLLTTMVLMGINRIVITRGKI